VAPHQLAVATSYRAVGTMACVRRRWVRVIMWVAGLLSLVLVAGVVTAVWTVQRSMPQTDGTLDLTGLEAEVRVLRDDHGIPQIYADTSNDLFFAQGYVQAQDRFFEMDFRRHLTAGRLSELFGSSTLEVDQFIRTLGWRRVAEQELALLTPETRRYLDQFAAGVNAYLGDHDGAEISLEYAVLGLQGISGTPEPWEAADSLAWLKAIAWDLGANMEDEITRSLLAQTLTPDQIATLYPSYPYDENRPIVTEGAIVDGVYEQDATGPGTRLPERPPYVPLRAREALVEAQDAAASLDGLLTREDGLGSNAWAVSGEHTASGAPLLANDPHLAPSMPGTWYQMGLHCTEVSADCPFDVSGFSFAGLPGIVIGHNADIAWGFTNLYPDVQDLYLERVVGDSVWYDGRKVALTTREETFEIAGEDEVTITVRASRHGPLLTDVEDRVGDIGADPGATPLEVPHRQGGYEVALNWTALTPGRTADALFAINAARDWDEFRDGARLFAAPAQSLVYADTAGHIGYQAPGVIPIRRTGNGDWPVPGWDPAYDWAPDPVPYNALPSVLDPDDGYVVTANQAVTKRRYPYYLGSTFDDGYRSQRIRQLLTRDDLEADDMTAIQLDDYSLLAERLSPLLLAVELDEGYPSGGQRLLRGWDYRMGRDSAAAAYFNVVWNRLLELTFADELPKETMPTGGSRWWNVLFGLIADPDNAFWDDVDTDEVERRDDIVREALLMARDDLTRMSSRAPQVWRWGQLHQLTLRNQTLGAEGSPVAGLFNRGGYELGGGPSIVNATSWDATEGYEVSAVPSMRMVIPLDDLDAARWINLTGASGHAYDDHYTDQTELWARGDDLSWAFTPDAVEAATEKELTLRPAP